MTIFVRTSPVRMLTMAVLVLVLCVGHASAEEKIPSKPTRYFNDYALTVSPATADRLNGELENLEKQSSNQIVAVIYPKMLTDSSVEDYCQRVFRAWGFGQKDQNNGAVLFVFLDNHKAWIQTGYGLEGSLPDATCKNIVSEQIAPRFKTGDFDGGMTAGVEAMIQATRGEYKGTGTTRYQREHPAGAASGGGLSFGTIFFLLFIAFAVFSSFRRRTGRGAMYTGGGPIFWGGGFGGGLGGGGGFGGGGDSGGGSSDGGGFISSGGGDSGGGGAGGDW